MLIDPKLAQSRRHAALQRARRYDSGSHPTSKAVRVDATGHLPVGADPLHVAGSDSAERVERTTATARLTLVSHHLCPYVQRAAIALSEKAVPFAKIPVDLSHKPDWFRSLSPLGKVPLLKVSDGDRETVIFESAVILEYLEETQPKPLHPADPLERAWHRSWIEFGSSVLNGISRFYNAKSDEALTGEASRLAESFERLEGELGDGPWFAGDTFSLVDAVYAPIFRYFDVFDGIDAFEILDDKPKIAKWRTALAERTSVRHAVAPDYPDRLRAFLSSRNSALSARILE